VTIGKLDRVPHVAADGSIVARDELTLKWTFDERIEDGLYCARALDLLRGWLEEPETLV
jgi:2-oxoisovalerate dehydrogenase E2 component (dihydrolipoyl transacylase)